MGQRSGPLASPLRAVGCASPHVYGGGATRRYSTHLRDVAVRLVRVVGFVQTSRPAKRVGGIIGASIDIAALRSSACSNIQDAVVLCEGW